MNPFPALNIYHFYPYIICLIIPYRITISPACDDHKTSRSVFVCKPDPARAGKKHPAALTRYTRHSYFRRTATRITSRLFRTRR